MICEIWDRLRLARINFIIILIGALQVFEENRLNGQHLKKHFSSIDATIFFNPVACIPGDFGQRLLGQHSDFG